MQMLEMQKRMIEKHSYSRQTDKRESRYFPTSKDERVKNRCGSLRSVRWFRSVG